MAQISVYNILERRFTTRLSIASIPAPFLSKAVSPEFAGQMLRKTGHMKGGIGKIIGFGNSM
jgi:hypothetical protein